MQSSTSVICSAGCGFHAEWHDTSFAPEFVMVFMLNSMPTNVRSGGHQLMFEFEYAGLSLKSAEACDKISYVGRVELLKTELN
jgi:hypothetical protein